jgi:DNA-binding MarR family transcriptional regulator
MMGIKDDAIVKRLMASFGGCNRRHWARSLSTDLKPSSVFLLWHLKRRAPEGRCGGPRVNELARELKVSAPHVTQTIRELEARGFVERRADPEDGRVVRLLLSREGERFMEGVKARMSEDVAGLVLKMGAERSLLLADLLDEANEYFNGGDSCDR